MPWADFAMKYTETELPGKSKKTAQQVTTVFGHLERIVNPRRLCDVNESA